jgi:hypothetical protein
VSTYQSRSTPVIDTNSDDVQFSRHSMRREADREVREARWNSNADIGAA